MGIKLNIKQRIIGGFGLVVSITISLAVYGMVILTKMDAGMQQVSERTAPVVIVSSQLATAILEANRAVVQHTGTADIEHMERYETIYAELNRKVAGLNTQLQSMNGNIVNLSDKIHAIPAQLRAFNDLGPQIFQLHKEATDLAVRTAILEKDFSESSRELISLIDAHIDEVQGELETIRALYRLRDIIGSTTKTVLDAWLRDDIAVLRGIQESATENTTKIQSQLEFLTDEDVIDTFDIQEIADQIDTYQLTLTEPNRFLSLATTQFQMISDYREQLQVMNTKADQLITELKSITLAAEVSVVQAKSDAAAYVNISLVLFLLVSTVAVCIALIVGYWLIRTIRRPIASVISILKMMEGGDLRQRLDDTAGDEFAELSTRVNSLVEQLSQTIRDIVHNSSMLSSAADLTRSVSNSTRNGVENQKDQTEQAASAMSQISATVADIACNTERTLQEVTHTNKRARKGNKTAHKAVGSMEQLSQQISDAAIQVNGLGDEVQSIGQILDVIKEIAEQTNLLALNAAIEAARAGEQGRGFAVVSQEVRTLAGRTHQSTEEIEAMIFRLQEGAQQTIEVMDSSVNSAHQTREYVEASGEAFKGIVETMEVISGMSGQIAKAADQQSITTGEVAESVTRINEIAEDTATGANEVLKHSDNLAKLAKLLHGQVGHFIVDEQSEHYEESDVDLF